MTFNNEIDCIDIARSGLLIRQALIQCERANVLNAVVVYVKCPYEMSDGDILRMMYAYGTVVNIRRQYHQFDKNVETGVRSCLVRNVKKPIPSFIKVRGFSLLVRYKGQLKTCKICEGTDHLARECPERGRCFVCGSRDHRATWHHGKEDDAYENMEDDRRDEQQREPEDENQNNDDKEEDTLAEDDRGEDKHADDNDKEDKRKEDREEDGKEEDCHREDRHEDHQEDKGYKKSQVSAPSNPQPSEDSLPKNTIQVEKFTKFFKEALVPTQREEKTRERKPTNKKGESSPGPKTTGFWDESVKETRKRKEREELDDSTRKLARDDDDASQTQDMEQENLPSDDQDSNDDDDDDDNWVPYTRRGVQRFRRRRGSGAASSQPNRRSEQESAHQNRSLSQPTSESTKTPNQRGRGRGQKAM